MSAPSGVGAAAALASLLRIVEMLDHEVRVDEVERGALEGEAGADVAGDQAVESGVLLAGCVARWRR